MIRPWSVRLNAEADRLTRLGYRVWGRGMSLHAANYVFDAARSLRKAAEVMAERERMAAAQPKRRKKKPAGPKKWSDAWWKKHGAEGWELPPSKRRAGR